MRNRQHTAHITIMANRNGRSCSVVVVYLLLLLVTKLCTPLSLPTATTTKTTTNGWIKLVPYLRLQEGRYQLRPSSTSSKRIRTLLSNRKHPEEDAPKLDQHNEENKNNNNSHQEEDSISFSLSSKLSASTTTTTTFLPKYKDLIIFIITTIIVWLSEPLLSLVDTTIVGMTTTSCRHHRHNSPSLSSSSSSKQVDTTIIQIASLGPATMLYDSAMYLTYFLPIATTNTLGPALAEKDWFQLRKSTSHILGLGLVLGLLVMGFVYGLGPTLIQSIIVGGGKNNTAAPNSIVLLTISATTYAWIRATVAPFAVLGVVAQSFCLATLDTTTPAIAVAVASIVNLVGDWFLCPKWGIQGAAVATALATIASCTVLLHKVYHTTKQWSVLQEQNHHHHQQKHDEENERLHLEIDTPKDVDDDISRTRSNRSKGNNRQGDDDDDDDTPHRNDIPFLSFPDRSSLFSIIQMAGPIFLVMVGKVLCYSMVTYRATDFGIVSLAAHNIMMRIFFLYTCFGDSLSQAALSFYPQVSNEQRGQLLQRLLYVSTWMGVWNSQFAIQILKQFGSWLTKDESIKLVFSSHTRYLGWAVLLHPFIMLLEGTLLAKQDFLVLVRTYAITLLLHCGIVFSPLTSTFQGVWRALFLFQGIRLSQFALRVWNTSKRGTTTKVLLP